MKIGRTDYPDPNGNYKIRPERGLEIDGREYNNGCK